MPETNGAQYRRERYDEDFGPQDRAEPFGVDDTLPEAARRAGRRVPEAFSKARNRVQRGISGAQDYVKTHDVEDVLEDARNVARKNPRVAIVALVAVGFLIGRLMRRQR
ncbi:MAG: hypothetical protein V4813_05965 [Gemmatimonadota bacterium]